jgi:hypothetical protein
LAASGRCETIKPGNELAHDPLLPVLILLGEIALRAKMRIKTQRTGPDREAGECFGEQKASVEFMDEMAEAPACGSGRQRGREIAVIRPR